MANLIASMNMHEMIAQPFVAAGNAQVALCTQTINFLKEFAIDSSTNTIRTTELSMICEDPSGTIIPLKADGTQDLSANRLRKRTLVVPLISLLNVPAFQMQKVTVDLLIKVESQSREDTSLNVAASLAGNVNFGTPGVGANGSVQASVSGGFSKAKSDTNSTSIIYDVHMEAVNHPPAGLNSILEWLTSIKPASHSMESRTTFPKL
jgi:hypothetical protein